MDYNPFIDEEDASVAASLPSLLPTQTSQQGSWNQTQFGINIPPQPVGSGGTTYYTGGNMTPQAQGSYYTNVFQPQSSLETTLYSSQYNVPPQQSYSYNQPNFLHGYSQSNELGNTGTPDGISNPIGQYGSFSSPQYQHQVTYSNPSSNQYGAGSSDSSQNRSGEGMWQFGNPFYKPPGTNKYDKRTLKDIFDFLNIPLPAQNQPLPQLLKLINVFGIAEPPKHSDMVTTMECIRKHFGFQWYYGDDEEGRLDTVITALWVMAGKTWEKKEKEYEKLCL